MKRRIEQEWQDFEIYERARTGHFNHSVILCRIKFFGTWIKRRKEVNGAQHYREKLVRVLNGKTVEWDKANYVEQMWENLQNAVYYNAREL